MSRYLLDTSIIIDLMHGDSEVQRRLAAATEVFTPSIALGELFYGARNSGRVDQNLAQTRTYAANYAILMCDDVVAEEYGAVRYELRVAGALIPENDMWIAAIARCHDLTHATRDAHFHNVAGLRVEIW